MSARRWVGRAARVERLGGLISGRKRQTMEKCGHVACGGWALLGGECAAVVNRRRSEKGMCWVLRAWVEVQGLLTIVDVVNGMGISHANKKERQDAIEHAQALARCGRRAEGPGAVDQRQTDQSTSECAQVRRKETGEGHTESRHVGCGWQQGSFKTRPLDYRATDMFVSQGHRRRVVVCRGIHGALVVLAQVNGVATVRAHNLRPRDWSGRAHRAAAGAVLAITHLLSKGRRRSFSRDRAM